MNRVEWTDDNARKEYRAGVGWLTIVVHSFVKGDRDGLYLTCSRIGLDCFDLLTADVEFAKETALTVVCNACVEHSAEFMSAIAAVEAHRRGL